MKIDDLPAAAEKERARQAAFRTRIRCCVSTACLATGAEDTYDALLGAVDNAALNDNLKVSPSGCMGLCNKGPLVKVTAEDGAQTLYQHVDAELAKLIVDEHGGLMKAESAEQAETEAEETEADDGPTIGGALAYDFLHFRASRRRIEQRALADHLLPQDIPFFTRQVKVVLAHAGLIDPESLDEYIAVGGYQALGNALRMSPEAVIEEVKRSGLRGRGGAGYPTGLKWAQVRKYNAPRKFVIANGDEGDPGAYMDRTLMEDDPHRVIEGVTIAGYAVGAQTGYLYVRGEYPIAVKRLEKAIRTAKRAGILGKRVLDTDFSFEIEIRIGAGAFVCGEETALMASVEGGRGMPHMRPPYPAEKGLWDSPTLINNVETFGNIPPILLHGADWYAQIGTEKSKGTKIFALTGRLNHTGLIEVPIGISLREIVYDIGGGIPDGHTFKAAQTGGPSGGCIPPESLDTPVDYETLRALGSIMGSGGLIVMDDTSSMPDVAKFFMEFCVDESCGKCVPCRVGTLQILRLLEKVLRRKAVAEDLEKMESLCHTVQRTSMCGLGTSAPNPVMSTLRYFRHEYEALLKDDPREGVKADEHHQR